MLTSNPHWRRATTTLGSAYFIFLFLLSPLKVATMVGECAGMDDPSSLDWIFSTWPSFLAPVWVGGGLLLVLTYARLPPLAIWRRDLPLLLPAWALVLASLVGWVATTETDEAQFFFFHVLSVACLVLALWLHLQARPESKPWLLTAILVSSLWITFSGWHQYFWGFAETREFIAQQAAANHTQLSTALKIRLSQDRVFASFAVPNSYAGHLLLVIPLALVLLTRWGRLLQPPALGRVFAVLLALCLLAASGAAFYWTGSRAALLALGAMCMLLALAFAVRARSLVRRHRVLFGAAALLALMAVSTAFVHETRRRSQTNAVSSASFRLAYYDDALLTFAMHPLTGAGLGEFLSYHLLYKPQWLDEEARLVHNTMLQFLAECGIVGGVAALLFCGQGAWILWALWRRRWPASEWWLCLALFLGLFAWQFHSQLDLNFHVPASAWLAACVPLLLVDWEQLPPVLSAKKIPAWCLSMLIFAVALLCLWPITRIPGEIAYTREQQLASTQVPAAELASVAVDAAALLPHSPYPWWTLADFAQKQGDFMLAEQAARRAMALVPRRSQSYNKLAWALAGQQKWAAAVAAMNQAIACTPTNKAYKQERRDLIPRSTSLPVSAPSFPSSIAPLGAHGTP